MHASQLVVVKELEACKGAYRPSDAVLRDNAGVKYYWCDTDSKVYEAKQDLDWVRESEYGSDRDYF